MPQPRLRADLSVFAAALAARLPGHWTSAYHQHTAYRDQFPAADQLWGTGDVSWALSEFVLGHDAVLSGPGGQRLYVVDRPLHHRQFLVGALVPDHGGLETHHFHGVVEPNGIAVSNVPARAAATVLRRLLPSYRQALAAVYHNALAHPGPRTARPAPPPVEQVITLTWQEDGTLATPSAAVSQDAARVLYRNGFQYWPSEQAFLLPAVYGDTERARRLHNAGRRLAAHGIGVNVRHAAPQPVPLPSTLAAAPVGRHR